LGLSEAVDLRIDFNQGDGTQLMLRTTQEQSREARVTVIRASTGEEIVKIKKDLWNENLLSDKQLPSGLYIVKYETEYIIKTFKYFVR
jgi:hypothetical protein